MEGGKVSLRLLLIGQCILGIYGDSGGNGGCGSFVLLEAIL